MTLEIQETNTFTRMKCKIMKEFWSMCLKINTTKPVFQGIKYSTGDFPVILAFDTTAAA